MTFSNVPAHIASRNRRGLAQQASAGLGTGMPPYISIKGNRFTLFDAGGNSRPVETYDPQMGPYLDCIIVDANQKVSKIYYSEAYDPENPGPPDCFSDNGLAPSMSAAAPQSQTCEACPHNKWGSAVSALTGSKTKACDDYKKLAIFLPQLPEMLFQLRVPPASLAGRREGSLKKYMEAFAGQNFDLPDVYTRIRFDMTAVGILIFEPSPLGFVPADIVTKCDNADQTKLDRLVGRDDVPYQGALPAPAPAPQITQTAPPASAPAPAGFGAPPANVGGFGRAPAPAAPFGTPAPVPAAPRKPGRPRKSPPPEPQAQFGTTTPPANPNASPPTTHFGGGTSGGTAPFRPPASAAVQPSGPGGAPPAANPELEQALANAFGLPT